jgi:ABC-type cobalamin/Fe3+-siderophores transport system ATPase subunit
MLRKVILRNYRCFGWDHPAFLSFDEGIGALVGPNNSGKSSALRAIYELRNFFPSIIQLITPGNGFQLSTQFLGVTDPSELANDSDNGVFHIEFFVDIPYSDISPSASAVTNLILEFNTQNSTCFATKIVARSYYETETILNKSDIRSGVPSQSPIFRYPEKGIALDYSKILSFCSDLAASKYFPAFRNAINEGANNYYDIPVGTSLVHAWDSWKAGNIKAHKIAISKVEQEISSLLGFKTLQINADQTGKTLDVIIDGRPHKLYEVGSGVAQLIIVLAAALVMKPKYILIDEPEISLHPSLQLNFLLALASYAEIGLLYSTHSIGLARSSAQSIYSTHRTPDGGSKMEPLGAQQINFSEWLGELSYSTRLDLGCEGLVLVEGPTDVLLMQEFLRKIGKDGKFVVMQLGGSTLINSKISVYLSELLRIIDASKINIFIDSEKNSESAHLSQDRQDFLNECSTLGINAQVSVRRATENYLSQTAIQSVLGKDFQALQPYELLKTASKRWSKGSNWKIAKATSFDDIKDTDLGEFLSKL